MRENVCTYVCVWAYACWESNSTQLFISLAKPQKLSLLPTPLVIEMIEEFTLAFVKRSVSFLLKQRSGPGPSLAGERIILPIFSLITFLNPS